MARKSKPKLVLTDKEAELIHLIRLYKTSQWPFAYQVFLSARDLFETLTSDEED